MADPQAGRASSAGGAPSGAGGAPFGSDDEDDEDEPMPRALALPESASVSARKVAKKAWPPVEPGNKFRLYCSADLVDYLAEECTALMEVHEGESLSCCEVGCDAPDFGASVVNRSAFNAAKHLRAKHLVKMLRSRATAAAAALVPAPKLAKAGAPVDSTAGAAARLGARGVVWCCWHSARPPLHTPRGAPGVLRAQEHAPLVATDQRPRSRPLFLVTKKAAKAKSTYLPAHGAVIRYTAALLRQWAKESN